MFYEESEATGFVCCICQQFVLFSTDFIPPIILTTATTTTTMHCQNCIDSSHDNFCVGNSKNEVGHSRCQLDENYVQISSKFLSPRNFAFKDSGWSTCLLILVVGIIILPSSIMSTPLPKSSSSGSEHLRHHKDHHNRLHDRPSKFINPCRLPSTLPTVGLDADIQTQPDVDIFHNIITQSTKALRQAQEFVDDFYKESFGTDRKSDSKFEDIRYDFLADATIKMNEFNNEQLSKLDVEEQIKFLYQSLQRFAVGLEAIVLDQACYGGGFYHHFNEAEYQLKYVLCELQIAMLEKNIAYTDITRDIMSEKHRDIESATVRNVRDFVIFRDYIKALQYVNTTFQYFHDRAAVAK